MSVLTCAGVDVLRGAIMLPLRGAWTARLELDESEDGAPTGSVTLAADGGLSLVGTVVDSGTSNGRALVLVVGGRGGLGKRVSGAFRQAQLRDPLGTTISASGESLAASSSTSVLRVSLDRWTLGVYSAARALEEIADVATAQLGEAVNWRILSSGDVWIGTESWPAATLDAAADVLDVDPVRKQAVLGVEVPALLPGVNLDGVGRLAEVVHSIEPDAIRTVVRWS